MTANKDARALELYCGTGRLPLPIAREMYSITGVDYTPSMLNQAKLNASKEGRQFLFDYFNPTIEFISCIQNKLSPLKH